MNKEANKPTDQTNSGRDEAKSEEFLNFERGIDHMLSLPKEEVERIRKEVPLPKGKRKRKTN